MPPLCGARRLDRPRDRPRRSCADGVRCALQEGSEALRPRPAWPSGLRSGLGLLGPDWVGGPGSRPGWGRDRRHRASSGTRPARRRGRRQGRGGRSQRPSALSPPRETPRRSRLRCRRRAWGGRQPCDGRVGRATLTVSPGRLHSRRWASGCRRGGRRLRHRDRACRSLARLAAGNRRCRGSGRGRGRGRGGRRRGRGRSRGGSRLGGRSPKRRRRGLLRGRLRGLRSRARRKQGQWVDVALGIGGQPNTEVHVGPVHLGLPARPDRAHCRAFCDPLALPHADRAEVDKRHRVAVVALDGDRKPVLGDASCERHEPRCRRAHLGVRLPANVDTAVLAGSVGVGAEHEEPQDGPVGRPGPGRRGRRGETQKQRSESE